MKPLLLSEAPAAAASIRGVIDVAPGTIQWMESAVRSLSLQIGRVEAAAVDGQSIAEWHESLQDYLSPATANSYLRAIRTMYARLVQAGTLAANPATAIPFAPEEKRPKAMLPDTFAALCQTAKTGPQATRDLALLHTLYGSGCRAGELLGMRLRDTERCEGGIAIQVVGKHRRRRPGRGRRFVYLAGPSAAAMEQWLTERPGEPNGSVFLTARGKPLSHNGFYTVWRRLTAGFEEGVITNPHSLRHLFAIRKLDEGHDLALVSAWLGHADPAFTASVYVVRREDQLRRAFFGTVGQ